MRKIKPCRRISNEQSKCFQEPPRPKFMNEGFRERLRDGRLRSEITDRIELDGLCVVNSGMLLLRLPAAELLLDSWWLCALASARRLPITV